MPNKPRKSAATAQIDALIGKAGKKGKKDKGGGAKKIGRYNTHPSSMRYRAEQRWEKNKRKKLKKHIKKFPKDSQARTSLASMDYPEDRAFLAGIPA